MTVDYEQKYCLECIHFEMSLGAPKACYGKVAYLNCNKGHWYLGPRDDYEEYYKERMCDARTCPDFEPDLELAEIGKGV